MPSLGVRSPCYKQYDQALDLSTTIQAQNKKACTVILKVYLIPSAQLRKLTQCQTNNEKIMRMPAASAQIFKRLSESLKRKDLIVS